MPADHDASAAPSARRDADPLDVLLERPSGWRGRLDELTGGLGFLPTGWTGALTRGRLITVAAIVVVLVVAWVAGVVPGRGRGGSPNTVVLPRASAGTSMVTAPTSTDHQPPGTAMAGIWVAAAGAVEHAGLYRLRPDARVSELVIAAGGLAPDADPDRINLAAMLRDGQRLYVPRRGETSVPTAVTGEGGSPPGAGDGGGAGSTDAGGPSAEHPVNLNTATAADLDALPGVGPATAAAIIEYRTSHGPFTSVDDLKLVHGIGPAKLAQLHDLVTV